MKRVIALIFVSLMLAATSAFSASPEDILGVWNTEDNDAKIEIYQCNTTYCGKVVWLKEPTYPKGSDDGVPGTPMLDNHNPDPKVRKNPLIGTQILSGFEFVGENLWKHGTIYNPETGKTYQGKITLISPQHLHVRGFIGISLFGSTTTWTR